jgi:Cys-rich protein (TIGR01571 family)
MRMAGFLNFFSALGLVIGMTLIGFLTFGMGFFVLLGVMVMYRQRLQAKFNIRRNSTKDLLSLMFCPWCSIAQEARQVEEAYLARHPAVRAECKTEAPVSVRPGFGKV